ncbi:hypothetical protein ACN9JG_21025 (plasmid) [Cereibacter azotoformans]|uniref:Uncharacterized protein n=1 Tax=Cereibacter azotoformans TaxID=43057 RepID=A0A2T5JT91_9RHOB|nr:MULTISPECIES: hypothetical protein [Cereibacter]PTR13401.1 hypothetical protein C8J28_12231 [Cereibacter azotoformans]
MDDGRTARSAPPNAPEASAAGSQGTSIAFANAEWRAIREQINILLQAIWRFESLVLGGYAAFYAWILSGKLPGEASVSLLVLVALLFSLLVLHRIKIEYSILMTLASYSRLLEDYIYASSSARPPGWEKYLSEDSNDPDRRSMRAVFRRYRNTGMAAGLLVAFNAVALLVLELDYLLELRSRFEAFHGAGPF